MANFKQAVSGAATVFMVAALLVLVAVAVVIGAGYKPQVVVSGSMEPKLERGHLLFVKPTPAGKLKVGDVITFQNPFKPKAKTVTHRIVAIRQSPQGPVFTTKGDANPAPDPWNLTIEKNAGLLAIAIPYVGKLSFLVGSTSGYVLLFAIPLLLLLLFGLRTIWTSGGNEADAADRQFKADEHPDDPNGVGASPDAIDEFPPPPPARSFGYPREI